MTLEERARGIVGKYIDQHVSNGICEPLATHVLSDLIENALRTVRDEALEEAKAAFREMRLAYHHQRVASGEIPAAQAAMFADDDAAQFEYAIRSLKTEVSRERETG